MAAYPAGGEDKLASGDFLIFAIARALFSAAIFADGSMHAAILRQIAIEAMPGGGNRQALY